MDDFSEIFSLNIEQIVVLCIFGLLIFTAILIWTKEEMCELFDYIVYIPGLFVAYFLSFLIRSLVTSSEEIYFSLWSIIEFAIALLVYILVIRRSVFTTVVCTTIVTVCLTIIGAVIPYSMGLIIFIFISIPLFCFIVCAIPWKDMLLGAAVISDVTKELKREEKENTEDLRNKFDNNK